MKFNQTPTHARNLTAWFVAGGDTKAPDYITLEEAMATCEALLHETGDVNELLVENPTDRDLFIQAGDMVKGGRQDRTLGADFIVPAHSGKVPIPAFCVESARWHRRGAESAAHFSKSDHITSSKKLHAALRLKKQQGEVWNAVAENQAKLSGVIGSCISGQSSPTSLQLAYEHQSLKEALDGYLAKLPAEAPLEANGVVWAINGRLSHADIYASPTLFTKLWGKLRRAAAMEALSEHQAAHPGNATMPDPGTVADWLNEPAASDPQIESLPPRTRLTTHRGPDRIHMETHDTAPSARVHLSVLAAVE